MSSIFKRAIGSLRGDKRARARYAYMVEHEPLAKKTILIESQQGRTPCGNMFYVLRYLSRAPEYAEYSLYFVAQKAYLERFSSFLDENGIDRVELVGLNTPKYVRLLATAQFLVTDTSFPDYYIKRSGQIIWNTWHGTPLKALGRRDRSAVATLGNVQKNLALADYLSMPNEFTASNMLHDYMIDKIYRGTILYCGYPRNNVLHPLGEKPGNGKPDEGHDVRRYAYMPTWRSRRAGFPRSYASAHLIYHLLRLDGMLCDDEVMFVNVHPLDARNLSFGGFKHIRPFPSDAETYAFLDTCDALVTDYSSVLFDFAPTRKPIVLFTFDEDEYLRDRGMYLTLDELPFPRATSCEEVLAELRHEQTRSPESKRAFNRFLETYCSYDGPETAKLLCDRILLGADNGIRAVRHHDNGCANVILYAGNLARNGITSSALSLLSQVHDDGRNYFIAVPQRLAKANARVVAELPDWLQYIPYPGKTNMSLFEKAVQYVYGKYDKGLRFFTSVCKDAYRLNLSRRFGFIPNIAAYVQFNGYDFKEIMQFSVAPAKRIIYMHSDMSSESKTRGNSRLDLLRYAYATYDAVAVVSDGLVGPARTICPSANVKVAPNVFDVDKVRGLSQRKIAFDPETESNVTVEQVVAALDDPNTTVLITIGRFSPEKGHLRLFDAFDSVCADNPDRKLKLIVIGGNSFRDTYEKELSYLGELSCAQHIMLVKGMSNPYAILRRSDGFILSSLYEGFGLVLLEADALGIPIVSTDIDGPRAFMLRHGGALVPNSADGIREGLNRLVRGEVQPLFVDYDEYNKDAIEAFEDLLK